ncbi:MAG: trypsin-like peptidase domain-containing protein [Peptococcaceae bacterium]|nr:trypsin-like peptidase domain-containing protein [Peptococcaceae bacterium]
MEKSGCRSALLGIILLLIGIVAGSLAVSVFFTDSDKIPEERLPWSSQEDGGDSAAPQTPKNNYNTGSVDNSHLNGVMGEDTVRNIVEICGDSVVKIETETTVSSGDSLFNDPFFQEFFGYQAPQSSRKATGMGSGFLFTQDGYILTNNHVIENASSIKVYLTSNEKPYEAKVVGTAAELDLAVIKIEGDDFPYIAIGDSSEMEVGDWVVAIGNPYGLDHTVTVGVISATGRPLTIEGTVYQNLLQTDAAINPGNSGGPMLNLKGEVIGINTAVSTTGQGIGFAIPSSTVLGVIDELKAGSDRVRPWIGISMQAMTKDMMNYFNITGMDQGVIVYSVVEGAPADKAGIRRGDVLISIDDQAITDPSQVQSIITYHNVGDQLKIKIFRDGDTQEFMVTLEASNNE